ncbi:C6 zinc finger domain-containing protein [Fusarium bulbicola]|nr:C6 zinc finger domain-containing protein [Fusarium bulbicola]
MEQARREAATIPRGVHMTAEVHSWNHFYNDYAIHSGITLFNILPRFYTSSSSTCFQEALHAVALVSSARQFQQSGMMVLARRHYGGAITALNVALDDTVLTADDSVLVALLLLSLFEMIVPECFRKDADFQCHIHFRGALLLLRWRAERARNSELDESCFMFLSHICVRVNPYTTRDQQPTAFNNMFEVSTKTTEAIARSLYQTVRYHVAELVSSLVTFVEEGGGARHELDYQFNPSMRYMVLEQVSGEICAVLDLESYSGLCLSYYSLRRWQDKWTWYGNMGC